MEVNIITLDDNKEYIIIDTVSLDNKDYFILVSKNDKDDILIRRVDHKDNMEVITELDSTLELNNVLSEYRKRQLGDDNE